MSPPPLEKTGAGVCYRGSLAAGKQGNAGECALFTAGWQSIIEKKKYSVLRRKKKAQVFRKRKLFYGNKGKRRLLMRSQHFFHPYHIPPFAQLVAALVKMSGLLIAHGPVSYTRLDVYKRQVYSSAVRRCGSSKKRLCR